MQFSLTERTGNILPFVKETHGNTEICLISMELMDVSMDRCLKIYHRMGPKQNHMSRLEGTNSNICNMKLVTMDAFLLLLP
jgi:hypothetical protein